MVKKNIRDIASVIAGYTFRTALKSHKNGLMAVVQAKDILDNIFITKNSLTKIDLQEYQTRAIIQESDIVISSRGSFRASIIKGDAKNIIASSSVYVLRIENQDIFPEYLAIYLNTIEGQKKIKEKMTGSVIKTILRRDLENIEIPIPDKKMQDIVINLFQNKQAQQKLLDRKKILINQIIESSITNYLK